MNQLILNTEKTVNIYRLFNLDFGSDNILSCFFLLFLIIDFYLLVPTVVARTFNSLAKLIIPIGIQNEEATAAIETNPLTVEI